MEYEGQDNTSRSWYFQNGLQESEEGTGGIENPWEDRNHLDDSITEISQNSEKTPGDLRRLQ